MAFCKCFSDLMLIKSENKSSRALVRTYHETVVQYPRLPQPQATNFVAKNCARHNCCARGAETTAQRYPVNDVYMSFGWESALAVTSEEIQGNPRDQVSLRIEAYIFPATTLILTCDGAVQWKSRRRVKRFDGHLNIQVERESEAEYIKARPDVCG
jgi:hypothetical protein